MAGTMACASIAAWMANPMHGGVRPLGVVMWVLLAGGAASLAYGAGELSGLRLANKALDENNRRIARAGV